MKKIFVILVLMAFVKASISNAQTNETEIPKIVKKDGRYCLSVDGQPFLMLGGQSSNSSTWPKMLPGVWKVIESANANTLEIPVYWEQFEPEPGKYDYSMIELLLDQARERDIHLVLLWFATWKNGSNHYIPEWMKKDSKKYFNVVGRDGKSYDSPSPHAKASMEADAKAFTEFMKYLKKADSQHTVIMVQVENEPGNWQTPRDYSETAQKLFEQAVPAALLSPAVLKELNVPENTKGNWQQVFGINADVYFNSWYIASYIEYVAAAGKAVYPLPMYVNVSLRDPLTKPEESHYESGGATDNVIPIWKVAAPSIDILAPDIYAQEDKRVLKVIDLYTRPDNALLVPETGNNVKYIYKIIENGIGYSPFGVDRRWIPDDKHNLPIAEEYKLLKPMSRQLAKWQFEGRIYSTVEPEDHSQQKIDLGNWQAVLTFGRAQRNQPIRDTTTRPATGKAMIIKLGEDEFMAVGTSCRFTFNPLKNNAGKEWQYLRVEEGYYENGEFRMIRVLNGDETDWGGPYIGEIPALLHITLITREQ